MGEKKSCAKAGRNASKPTRRRYHAANTMQRRREERIKKHILLHPNDKTAPSHLRRVEDEPIRHLLKADHSLPNRQKGQR